MMAMRDLLELLQLIGPRRVASAHRRPPTGPSPASPTGRSPPGLWTTERTHPEVSYAAHPWQGPGAGSLKRADRCRWGPSTVPSDLSRPTTRPEWEPARERAPGPPTSGRRRQPRPDPDR